MRLETDRLYVFSGLMFAGKDHVAKQAALKVVGFADPIYQLVESLCGTSDKSVPGIRRMMQYTGQCGWGYIGEDYPWNPERAMFVRMVRNEGRSLTKDFKWVKWEEYGLRKDFWVNILLTRLGLIGTMFTRDPLLFAEMGNQAYRIGITNARFQYQLDLCKAVGFEHYHVRCSEETRRERMLMVDYEFDPKADQDVSEQMAMQFDQSMPDEQVIWNDHRPMPEGRKFLSVQDFAELVNRSPSFNLQEIPREPSIVHSTFRV